VPRLLLELQAPALAPVPELEVPPRPVGLRVRVLVLLGPVLPAPRVLLLVFQAWCSPWFCGCGCASRFFNPSSTDS
jgi:hypothetical protein